MVIFTSPVTADRIDLSDSQAKEQTVRNEGAQRGEGEVGRRDGKRRKKRERKKERECG